MAMLFDTTDTGGDHTGQALYYDPANAFAAGAISAASRRRELYNPSTGLG